MSLKISRANFGLGNKEVSVLRHLAQTKSDHMGAQYVMKLRDDFILSGPNGEHQCIVSQVAGNRLSRPLGVRYSCLGPSRLLVAQLFLGLEYLNSCNVGHGDLYTGNILFQLETFDSWSDEQLYECMGRPVTEEVVRLDGQAIESCAPAYTVHSGDLSRLEQRMMVSKILIVDFGASYFINKPPLKTTTPAQYAAPEVLRSIGVAPSSDVWALGCAAFEICAGYTLFKALFNPRQDVMKDMISMLGKPPDNIWKMWEERSRYFDEEGHAVRRTEQVISFQTYPLYDRVRDMARLYPADGRMIDMSELPGEHLETVELVQMHDFLSKVFVFNPRIPNFSAECVRTSILGPGQHSIVIFSMLGHIGLSHSITVAILGQVYEL